MRTSVVKFAGNHRENELTGQQSSYKSEVGVADSGIGGSENGLSVFTSDLTRNKLAKIELTETPTCEASSGGVRSASTRLMVRSGSMKKDRNVAGLLLQRAIGSTSRDMMRLAETKAACWDVEEQRCDLPRTTRSTFLMAFSHDGTKIASAHGDHRIYISDVKSGRCLHTLVGHPRTPWCLAFHPTFGDILASGCLGGEVRVWDLHGGCEVWTEERKITIASLAFHPTDQVLVVATNNEIHFWDWSRPKPFARCKTASERERVKLVRFDRYGHRLYTGVVNAPREEPASVAAQQPPQREEECVILQRYLSTLREQHQQLLLCLQGLRNSSGTSRNSTSPSPNAAQPGPSSSPDRAQSPTQADALRRARDYAAEVTTAHAHPNNVDVLEELGQVLQPRSYPVDLTAPSTSASGSASRSPRSSSALFSRPREFLLELQSLQRWYARECQRIRELLITRSWMQVRDRANPGNEPDDADPDVLQSFGGATRRSYEPQAVLQTRLSIQHIRNARNIMATILLLNRIQDAFRAQAISQISRVLERELAGLIDHICAMLCELASHGNGSLGFLRRVALRLVHACRRRLGNLPRPQGEPRSGYDRATMDEIVNVFSATNDWAPPGSEPSRPSGPSGLSRQQSFGGNTNTANLGPRLAQGSESGASHPGNLGNGEPRDLRNGRPQDPSSSTSGTSSARRFPGRNFTLYGAGEGDHRDRSAFQTFRHTDRNVGQGPSSAAPADPDRAEAFDQEDVTESLIRTDHMLRMIVEDLQGLLRYISGTGAPPRNLGNPDSGSHSDDENRESRPRFQDPRDQILWDRLRNIRSRSGMGPSEHYTLNRTTYRLQSWDFSKCRIPDISDVEANVVVRECLIQNDACVDISWDGRLLATFLPGRVSTLTLLGIHSLEPETFGQCLYLWNFRSNVISVSLSPLANYVLVGMGSTRRLMLERDGKLIIGDILQLVSGNNEREDYLQQIRTVAVTVEEQTDCSLNSTRWLPTPGQGFLYGTNRGELKICRPKGPADGFQDPVWFVAEGGESSSGQTAVGPAFWAPRRTYREIMESVYAPRAPFNAAPPPVRALFQETQSRGTQTEPPGADNRLPGSSSAR